MVEKRLEKEATGVLWSSKVTRETTNYDESVCASYRPCISTEIGIHITWKVSNAVKKFQSTVGGHWRIGFMDKLDDNKITRLHNESAGIIKNMLLFLPII